VRQPTTAESVSIAIADIGSRGIRVSRSLWVSRAERTTLIIGSRNTRPGVVLHYAAGEVNRDLVDPF